MDDITRATTFEESALLRVLGFDFERAERGERRVVLFFRDSDGKGVEALRRHNAGGIEVNSQAFCDALAWAKRIVFSARDSA